MTERLARLAARLRPTTALRRRLWFAACLLWLAPGIAAAQVLVVLSESSPGYEAVASELRAGLQPRPGASVRVDSTTATGLADVDAPTFAGYELVVTVGLGAAQAVTTAARPGAPPTLCLLIPRQAFARLQPAPSGGKRRMSALYIDQPLSRQLDLVRAALPERHRVGVIFGPSSAQLAGELADAASERSLQVASATVGESSGIYPALQKVLPDSDLLLLLPDPVAINADTVYGLLLTSYRAEVPVVGFSAGLLKAGALVSLFSTAQDQGRQGAEMARRFLAHAGALPAPEYPRYFSVRVNASVARSLGLHLPSEAELHAALAGGPEGADPAEAMRP